MNLAFLDQKKKKDNFTFVWKYWGYQYKSVPTLEFSSYFHCSPEKQNQWERGKGKRERERERERERRQVCRLR
jgi:hypothetical protein